MGSDSISSLLYGYLLQKGTMVVPSFGGFRVVRTPARNDFASKQIFPPSFSIVFDQSAQEIPTDQMVFLVNRTGTSRSHVTDQLLSWGQKLTERVKTSPELTWPEIGTFSVGSAGETQFAAIDTVGALAAPVGYRYVLREHIQHAVKVGEDERSNLEMESFFEEQKKTAMLARWKSVSILILILVTLVLGYRFSLGSFDFKSPRYNPVKPAPTMPTYRII
jgi:hypothetical protein